MLDNMPEEMPNRTQVRNRMPETTSEQVASSMAKQNVELHCRTHEPELFCVGFKVWHGDFHLD